MAEKYSSYSMVKRVLALTVLVAFFMCAILFRLLYLQVICSDSYKSRGMTQWLRDLPLTASRGKITDKNGVVLASSYTIYDVYVRPADIQDAGAVAEVLSTTLELDYHEVFEKITTQKYSEIKIKSGIEKDKVQEILKNYQSGIMFASNTARNYEYDSLLCQILGFVGSDSQGQAGLEAFYNSYLRGEDGKSYVESDLKGTTLDNSVTLYQQAINGLNVSLTIDFQIQQAVEKVMNGAMLSTGAKSVSAIVTNPKTSEILAVCTLPSYNLNDVPRDDIGLLNSLSRAKTITDTFEPGSTFKAIVTAIALQENVVTKHHYFYCGGFRIINGVKINCSRRSGHGSQSLEQGLMNSCNCVFMDIIAKIGVKKFYEYLEKFGFTSPLGIDFPGEVTAVLMPQSMVTAADLARMGFGQSIAISSLEMVNSFGAVINGGKVFQPHFVNTITTETGEVVYTRNATLKNQVISEENSKLMREMLFSVVDKGGGKYAKVDGYSIIGGKTGTAQKYENGAIAQGKYVASFIGFAPYDDPEYLVYVVVDEPQGSYYGGVVAAPLASSIFGEIFRIKNLSTSQVTEEKNIELPTFIGMTLTQAIKEVTKLGLQYLVQGNGDYVTGQVAAPGTMVAENDIVLLIFD